MEAFTMEGGTTHSVMPSMESRRLRWRRYVDPLQSLERETLPKRDFKYVIGEAKYSPTSELPRRWQSVRAALHATFSLRSAAESVPEHDARRGCRAEAAVFPPQ